ncbi:Coenzyme F420-reducing hydrogenase, beta subunit [Cnuella takakiae]|uniref:Coenzyme F420-reducing hydrogenase, beta subunit n=1 Tax=Cnuella takakiae TaxID=1302690 RepID=A0A1M4VDL1_9BACT|nr:Coenzyme F420 hydrogenase/dehydrogenase, beta subunit C-terminal domain [Cnuella takakiae]OLY92635.1 coenzyme F420 hydrogenase [Cnuella takakiae]SHE66930.1 Coenzyme F420-reducing hydrogenase, beta subunit [Cnuella takakiae]
MKETLAPKDIIKSGLCIGCGSCVAQNKALEARMEFDPYGQLKPKGSRQFLQTPSSQFTLTCPFSPAAKNENELAAERYPAAPHTDGYIGRFTQSYIGYVATGGFRMQGSSGGMVSWVAAELMRRGLIDGVAHVVPADPEKDGRFFKFRISRSLEAINQGAQSRYYPIDMSEILEEIRQVPGRYAIVGIPCFIKAVHLLRREDPVLQERIVYTLGLFCGHMKSARFVESFAWQMDVPIEDVTQVAYRTKHPERPANWYNARLTLKDGSSVNKDWWHLADGDWGAGYFMNPACNFCDDVVGETADISFGDAWIEPYASDSGGNNVVVIRHALVQQMIEEGIAHGDLHLTPVDAATVVQTQAAGFRQRREGMAYRLSWGNKGVQPIKRLPPDALTPTRNRKLIYRMRYWISEGSHRFFHLARKTGKPNIYIKWARMAAAMYHALAYQRGKLGKLVQKLKLTDA